jgi:hypothetical protein
VTLKPLRGHQQADESVAQALVEHSMQLTCYNFAFVFKYRVVTMMKSDAADPSYGVSNCNLRLLTSFNMQTGRSLCPLPMALGDLTNSLIIASD